MKFIYRLEQSDYVAFHLYHAAHSDVHKKIRRKHRLFSPIVFLVCSLILLTIHAYIGVTLFVVCAIIWYLASPKWADRHFRKQFEKYIAETIGDALKEPVSIELKDDGVHDASFLGQNMYKYSGIGKIVENNGYTYVYIGKGAAIILPHDRLPQDEIKAFIKEIQKRKDAV